MIRFPRYLSSGEYTDRLKLKYLLLILFLTNTGGISYSQQNPESNSRIINRLIDDGIIEVKNKLILLGNEKLCTILYDKLNPEAEYIARRMQNELQGFKVLLGTLDDSVEIVVELSDELIKVKYPGTETDNILGTKRVKREVTVRFNTSIKEKRNTVDAYKVSFSKTQKGVFDADKLASVEDNQFYFSRAVVPDESSTSKVLLPAIMISFSAAAIILFFTIRSK